MSLSLVQTWQNQVLIVGVSLDFAKPIPIVSSLYSRNNLERYELNKEYLIVKTLNKLLISKYYILNPVVVVCSRYYSVTQSVRSSQRWPIKSKPHFKAV